MSATERMARFIAETRLEDVPEAVADAAKTAIIDTVGVSLAAAGEPVAKNIAAYVRGMSDGGPATLIGASLKTGASFAALANATLGHALDFDDTNWAMFGHASVAVLPAALAVAEERGASGRDLLEAFIVGHEAASKLGSGMNMGLYNGGWHPTSALGTMGAAAAAARLSGMGVDETRIVLGLAASQASGVRANFGTMTKPLHAGLAAEAGVRSAGLAAAGMTASRDVLDATSGYCQAFSGAEGYDIAAATENLGNPFVFESPGNNLKPYPCCMSAHASIDALRDLISEEKLTAEGVDRIDLEIMEPNMLNLSYHAPKTGLEGKFSAEYTLSRMLLDGALPLTAFTDEAVNEPAVRETMEKVHVRLSENTDWTPGTARPINLTVRTRDGRSLQKRADLSRGNAGWPLTAEEVRAKFRDCAGQCLSEKKAEDVLSVLSHIEAHPDVRTLMSLLA
jgi:2-methylcitrate dehydratase PrpD